MSQIWKLVRKNIFACLFSIHNTISLSRHERALTSQWLPKILPNKDIIATVEDAVNYLEKEETDTIRAKVSLTLQNSKPPKDNLYKDEHKALKELQSDTSIVILPADKGRSTVILNHEDYHIWGGSYK